MIAVVNTILYKGGEYTSPQHDELIAEAERVVALGGYFKIRHYFDQSWFEEITIYYPENK